MTYISHSLWRAHVQSNLSSFIPPVQLQTNVIVGGGRNNDGSATCGMSLNRCGGQVDRLLSLATAVELVGQCRQNEADRPSIRRLDADRKAISELFFHGQYERIFDSLQSIRRTWHRVQLSRSPVLFLFPVTSRERGLIRT